MMKKVLVSLVFGVLLTAMFFFTGCYVNQPGETVAEGHRRHIRNVRIENQQMMADIDTMFLTDEPSRLSPHRIP